MSMMATSGASSSTSDRSSFCILCKPDDLVSGGLQNARDAFAHQERIVCDDYAHGISADTRVPSPGTLDDVEPTTDCGDPVSQAAEA